MQENIIGGTVTYNIIGDNSKLNDSLEDSEKKLAGLGKGLDGVKDAASKSFSAAAESAISFANNAVKAVEGVLDSISAMGSSLKNTFEQISGINMPTPDMGYATHALSIGNEMAAKMEGASMGITLMTKDAARTDRIMNKVVEDATRTTFNVSNLLQFTQQIGAAAKGDYEGAEKAALGFGGAMVAAGNGLRDMGLVVRNIQQGMARGYNSIDLRQFKTYIPQFTQIMSAAGYTDEMIIKMGVDGAKVVNDVISQWVETEQIWEKYEMTYTNLKESLNEALQTTAMQAYTESGLFDAIKNAMATIKNNLPIIKEGLMGIASTIANIVNTIDWVSFVQGVASGIKVIANLLGKAAKVVMDIIKFIGGGDVGKGIERLLPTLVGILTVTKGLRKGFDIFTGFQTLFKKGGGITKAAAGFGETLKTISGTSTKSGGKLGTLTQLAISVAAFAAALWIINKALPDSNAGLLLAKLSVVAGTVIIFALIGKLVSALKLDAKGILSLTAMALNLALFGAAIWIVNKAVPDDIGAISAKLGILAGVIAAMGILAGVMGIKVIAQAIAIGLALITGIAATLAITAKAISYANDQMPADFGGLQAKIGSLALVITEIGVLAGVFGAIEVLTDGVGAVVIAAGLATIISIAGTLALAASALKEAYNNMPDDFGNFQAKIGSIALISAELTGLGVALGAAQIFSLGMLTVGLLTLVEISKVLADSAINIRIASENMPDNIDLVKDKIKSGVDFLMEIKETYGGNGGLIAGIMNFFWNDNGTQAFDTILEISRKLAAVSLNLAIIVEKLPASTTLASTIGKIESAVEFLMQLRETYGGEGGLVGVVKNFFWNEKEGTQQFDTVIKIAEKLQVLAGHLEKLAEVSNGKLSRVVNGNLFPTLKQAMETLRKEFTDDEPGGFIFQVKNFFWNDSGTEALDSSVKIAETLGKLVDNLAKIQDVQPGKLQRAVQVTIPILKDVVTKLKEEFTEKGGFIESIKGFFSNENSTETLDKSKEIAEKLGGLVENLAKIQSLEIDKLKSLASNSGDENPIIKLKDVVTKIKETFVDDADSVTNKLKEYDVTGLETAKKVAENIKQISDTISGISNLKPDVPGISVFIESMKTIVSKIIEQFGNDSDLISFPEDVATGIANVSKVVKDLSEMNENVNALKPVKIEDVKTRIAEIKEVVQEVINIFSSDAEGSITGLTDTFSDDWISSSVNQVLTTINGMKAIAQAVQDIPVVPTDVTGQEGKIAKIRELIKEIVWTLDNSGEDALDLSALHVIDISMVPGLINDLKSIATNTQDFPDASKGAENLKSLTKGLSEALKNLPSSTEIENLYLKFSEIGNKLVTNLLEGFNNGIVATSADFGKTGLFIATEILKGLYGSEVNTWKNIGHKIVADIAYGINNAEISVLYEAGNFLLFVLNNALGAGLGNDAQGTGAPQTWYMIGQKIVSDIALGLFNADFSLLYQAGNHLLFILNNALGAGLGNDEFGSGSPQTWFFIGRKLVIDLSNGMLTAEDILDATGYQLQSTLGKALITQDLWIRLGAVIVRDLANGMLSAEELLNTTVIQLVQNMFTTLISNNIWFTIGLDIARSIALGISAQRASVIIEAQIIYNEIMRALDRPSVYNALGKGIPSAVGRGMSATMYVVEGAMRRINSLVNSFSTQGAYNAGVNVAIGFASGISYNIWRINTAVGNLSAAAINKLKDLLGIRSPSKVMMRLGEYTGQGLAKGLLNTENDVAKATLRTGRAIYETAYFSYKNVGANAGQGLVDGLNSMSEKVAQAAKNLASAINTEMDLINPISYTSSNLNSDGSSSNTNNTNNITLNNNIYNELDLSAAMSQLKWEMAKV